MLTAESEEIPEDFNTNLQQMGEEEEPYQIQNINTEERQPQEHALVGAYNNPKKGKPDLELNKAIQESRSGLFLDYPGTMNTSKENAVKLKLRDKRQEGFTDYKGEITDEIEPKFLANNFYPKDSVYYEIMSISGKQNRNNHHPNNQTQMNQEFEQ